MKKIYRQLLKQFENCSNGNLTLCTPENETIRFKGLEKGPSCDLKLYDWSAVDSAIKRGDVGFGEAYCHGLWGSSDVAALYSYLILNFEKIEAQENPTFLNRIYFYLYNNFIKLNTKRGSKSNIKNHYDIGNEFYRLWLDGTMTYSSALRKTASDTLEEAQLNKYHRFLDQMNVCGANILEIGCGWGGFAEQAALRGAKLTGLTLSEEQYRFAKQRVSGQAEILLQDYRDAHRVYDYVVSIEMFEAVGEKYWPVYFNKIKNCLVKGGKALIQTITIRDELFANYRKGTDYFRHYVFPGGFLPSKSAFCRSAQKVGLQVGQVVEFGHDYAWTLRQWLAKFTLAEESLIAEGRSESFLRAWRLYLNMCIAAFETKRTNVMQIILHR